jgi:hypothetical protein
MLRLCTKHKPNERKKERKKEMLHPKNPKEMLHPKNPKGMLHPKNPKEVLHQNYKELSSMAVWNFFCVRVLLLGTSFALGLFFWSSLVVLSFVLVSCGCYCGPCVRKHSATTPCTRSLKILRSTSSPTSVISTLNSE